LPHAEHYIQACPNRYFVRLTTRYSYDEIGPSGEVSAALHRVNGSLFGTHYKRRKAVFLATLSVQERSFNDGLHTHILVGAPEDSLTLKANPAARSVCDLIQRTWMGADPRGRRADGQDAREIHDFASVSRYVRKTIRSWSDFDHVDVLNTPFPDHSATVPL
jgi:hypothetical protein